MATMDPKVPFLGKIPKGDFHVDNPDGCVYPDSLGAYATGNPKGRDFSQGAGTAKGGIGNASGIGKDVPVK